MRTNIEIDDRLMRKAQRTAGTKTKRETVERALRELVERGQRRQILKLRGKFHWEGDLNQTRRSRGRR